jgi:hypothetical protein
MGTLRLMPRMLALRAVQRQTAASTSARPWMSEQHGFFGGSGGGGGGSGGGGRAKCPIDALKLGVCANVLSGLINLQLGTPPKKPCCSLIQGLADVEAAVCLCTALKANILGINLNVPIDLSLLVNYCGKKVPRGFQCQ